MWSQSDLKFAMYLGCVALAIGLVYGTLWVANCWKNRRDRRLEQEASESGIEKFLKGGGAKIVYNEKFNGVDNWVEVSFEDPAAFQTNFVWRKGREKFDDFVSRQCVRIVRIQRQFNGNATDLLETAPYHTTHFAES